MVKGMESFPNVPQLQFTHSWSLHLSFWHTFTFLSDSRISFFLSSIHPVSPFPTSTTFFHKHKECLPSPLFTLMISSHEREDNSTVALNEEWQAITVVHSHRYTDANNRMQRWDHSWLWIAILEPVNSHWWARWEEERGVHIWPSVIRCAEFKLEAVHCRFVAKCQKIHLYCLNTKGAVVWPQLYTILEVVRFVLFRCLNGLSIYL